MTAADSMAASIRHLLRAFTIAETRLPDGSKPIRYNGPEFQTLHFVADHPGCMSASLAAFLGVSPTTAQSIIDRLIRRGLLIRQASVTSQRAVALTLTPSGKAMHAAILAQDRANCTAMLSALPLRDRDTFIALLNTVAATAHSSPS
jgi:DNA-binding MarR family transcriptional regulator